MDIACCICKKVKRDGRWLKVDALEARPESHGYCPECAATLFDEIEQRWPARPPANAPAQQAPAEVPAKVPE